MDFSGKWCKGLIVMVVIRRVKEYVRWYKYWGTLPVPAWVQAAEQFREKNFLKASKRYRVGLRKSASHPAANSARFDLAYCYYKQGKYDLALEQLSTLIDKRVTIKEAYLLYSRIKTALGLIVSAKKAVALCEQLFPDDAQVLSCLTHATINTNGSSEEILLLKRKLIGIKRDLELEDNLALHVDTALAHLEIRFGDIKKGERILARVLATGAAPYEAILLRGERFLELGRLGVARQQLNKAMSVCPNDPRPICLIARSYLRVGKDYKPDWALQLAQAACKASHWQNSDCLSVLARAYEAQGEDSYASLLLEKVKELPSTKELDISFFSGNLEPLKFQKVSNS